MQLAEDSVRKTNAEEGENSGRKGGLIFCPTDGAVRERLLQSDGKTLLLSDGESFSVFSQAAGSGKTLSIVLDEEDALPLFSMPDGVRRVFAAGRAETLKAARCFAAIRDLPCTLFPASLAMDGVFGDSGEVTIAGERTIVPLAAGEVVCDLSFAAPSAPRAYARLFLSRLALFEDRALRYFKAGRGDEEAEEKAYSLLSSLTGLSAREIALRNAQMRKLEAEGAYVGEGVALARSLGERGVPEREAYRLLTALYRTFFAMGKPKRYGVPDYRARALAAGRAYSEQKIPSVREYSRRALALEGMRASFSAELSRLPAAPFDDASYAEGERGVRELKKLPETAGGLSAVIRDFGLMDGL